MKTQQRPAASIHLSRRTPRERGMASIVITLVTMLVITLIVLGFAEISRREQRQALDQQLSAQAFYAAESAVEDAKTAIQAAIASGQQPVGKSNCNANNPGGNYPINQQTVLDQENKVSYTCLKVDVAPRSATYDGVGEDSIVIPVRSAQPFDRIEIAWTPTAPPQGTPAAACPGAIANVFSPQPNWTCGYGVIRADIVPSGGTLTRNALATNVMTGFFVPTRIPTANGQVSYANGRNQPSVVAAACDTAAYGQCRAIINNLGNSTEFHLRVSSLYRPSNISAVAYQGGVPASFSGVQVVIDATGKAQDVLRRIQVRLPLKPNPGLAPNFAIQSNNALCKRFSSMTGYFNIPNDIVYPDAGNPMCLARNDGSPPIPPCTPNHDIVFVFDVSGSMEDNLQGSNISTMEQLKEVGRRFVTNTNIAPTTNHVGIVTFSDQGTLGVGLTSDQAALLAYIDTLQPDGGTNYLEGLDIAVNELNSPRARAGSPRIVMFVSDGDPNDDKTQIRATTQAMKDAGVRIYTIGLNNSSPINIPGFPGIPGLQYDEQLLIDMSGNGGRYFQANDEAGLQAGLDAISIDLKCEPAAPGGGFIRGTNNNGRNGR